MIMDRFDNENNIIFKKCGQVERDFITDVILDSPKRVLLSWGEGFNSGFNSCLNAEEIFFTAIYSVLPEQDTYEDAYVEMIDLPGVCPTDPQVVILDKLKESYDA